jgi:hemolysin III
VMLIVIILAGGRLETSNASGWVSLPWSAVASNPATSTVDRGSPPLVPKPLLRGWSHVAAFAILAVLGVILTSVTNASTSDRLLLVIYVAGTLTMFGVSSMYHRLPWHGRGHSIMRRLDHSAIFLAIAGAYTPIMAIALDGWQSIAVLTAVWGGSIVGITLEWLPVRVPRRVFTAVYVVVGWSAVIAMPQLYQALGGAGFALVLGGGLLYTIGAVVYALKRPDPWPLTFGYHEIFHMFTIAGAGCHLAAIAFYVAPLM